MNFGQNVCSNDILNEFENVSGHVKKLGQILEKACVMLQRPHFLSNTVESWS